jgi:hypothetical protein
MSPATDIDFISRHHRPLATTKLSLGAMRQNQESKLTTATMIVSNRRAYIFSLMHCLSNLGDAFVQYHRPITNLQTPETMLMLMTNPLNSVELPERSDTEIHIQYSLASKLVSTSTEVFFNLLLSHKKITSSFELCA